MEQIFPFMRVRFISINDHYDSAEWILWAASGFVPQAPPWKFYHIPYRPYTLRSGFLEQRILSEIQRREAGGWNIQELWQHREEELAQRRKELRAERRRLYSRPFA